MGGLLFRIIIAGLIFFVCSCKAQPKNQKAYTIDNSISSEINRRIEAFDGKGNASISFTVYEGEKVIAQSSDNGEAALAFTSFFDNKLVVDCINGIDEGFGFSLFVGKDTSFVKFKAVSYNGAFSFKLLNDNTPQPEVYVPCTMAKVTLSTYPKFTHNEVVEGKVDLISESFLEISEHKERKVSFKIEVYFRSEPLPVINGGYKTLKK
jgi:hypothetical protein